MKKKHVLLLIISIFVLSSCNSEVVIYDDFSIIGDVNNSFNIVSTLEESEAVEYEYNGVNTKAYDIKYLIDKAQPLSENFSVVIVSNDLFSTKLDGGTIEDTYLVYDKNEKWVYVSEKHPKNSKVKGIKEIIIVNNEENYDFGINIIKDNITKNYSVGNLFANGYELMPVVDGNTAKTVDGQEYSIDVMKYKRVVSIDKLMESNAKTILLTSKKGEYQYLYNEDVYVELNNSIVNVYDKKTEKLYEEVNGILLDPPSMSNLEIYGMVSEYLSEKEKVLVVLVDGFSYYQYQNIVKGNNEYYLSNVKKEYKSTSVYKPVTNAGHSYGPFGNETINRLKVVDSYIKDLVSKWEGKVLIISDHGMHETESGGSHGQFRSEDIYVPILVMDGEK